MSPQDIVQKQVDFYNNHDLDGFISTYHEDIKIYNLIDNSIILEGKEYLREKYSERFQVLKVHAEVQNRMVIGNRVIDHEHVTTINTDSIVKAVAIYELEDALIKRVWFVFE